MVLDRSKLGAGAESRYHRVIRIRKWPPGSHVGLIHCPRDSLVDMTAVPLSQHFAYTAAEYGDCRSDRPQTNQELASADDFRPTDFALGYQSIGADSQAVVDRDTYDSPR